MSGYFNVNDSVGKVKSRFPKLSKFGSRINKKLLIVVLIALIGLPLTIFLSERAQDYRSRAQEAAPSSGYKQYSESLSDGQIKPFGQILEVDLHYERASKQAPLTISKLEKMNGYAPRPVKKENAYSLVIKDSTDTLLYTLPFFMPGTYTDPPSPDGSDVKHQVIELDSVNFSLTTPYIVNATQVSVVDAQGRTILAMPITSVEVVNNTPSFYSIKGDDFMQMNKASTQTAHEFLDVTFIGDKYAASESGIFHSDVNRFIAQLLTLDPFASRSSQILFHYIDNVDDLGCHRVTTPFYMLICDDFKINHREWYSNE